MKKGLLTKLELTWHFVLYPEDDNSYIELRINDKSLMISLLEYEVVEDEKTVLFQTFKARKEKCIGKSIRWTCKRE